MPSLYYVYMANRKSFTDYLSEAQSKYATAPVAAKPKGNQNFLDWAIDIASRPFRSITNIPNQLFNEMNKQAEARKTGKNYDVLGGLGNVATANVRGFWSMDPNDQPTGSGLIEKGTDAFGNNFDQNYVDTQDNVNPWVKGIGGFAIDVAADPLTYLPGGVIASAGRGAIAGVKTAVKLGEAGSVLAAAAKGAVKGVPDTVKFGTFTNRLKPVGLKQWQELRQYEKFSKTANKSKIVGTAGEESLLALAKGEQSVEKATAAINAQIADRAALTGKEIKAVTPEEVTKASQKASRYVSGTEATMGRYATREADLVAKQAQAAEALAVSDQVYADMAKAAPPIPKETQTLIETPTNLVKASELIAAMPNRQALLNITEGAIARNEGAAKAVKPAAQRTAVDKETWLAQQVALAQRNSGHKVPHLAGENMDGRKFPVGHVTANELKAMQNPSAIPVGRRLNVEAKLDSAYQKYVTDLSANDKAIAKEAASRTIMDYLTLPAQADQIKAVMGEDALRMIGEYTQDSRKAEALQYINDIVRGKVDPDTINKFGSSKRELIANAVFKHNEIDIPETNARKLQDTSTIDAPINASAAAEADAGQTLATRPEYAGMDEETVDAVAKTFHGWFRDEFLSLKGYAKTKVAGVVKNAKTGLAKWYLQYNSMDFYTLHERFVRSKVKEVGDFNAWAKEQGLKGAQKAASVRAKELFDYVLPRLRLSNGWMNDKAIFGFLGVGEDAVHLYWDQVLETWNKWQWTGTTAADGLKNRNLFYAAVFNEGSAIPLTNLMEAQHLILTNKALSPADLEARVIEVLKKEIVGRDGKKVKNALNETDEYKRIYGHYPRRPSDNDWMTTVKNTNPDLPPHNLDKQYYFGSINPEGYAKEVARMLTETGDELAGIVKANNDAVVARFGSEASAMPEELFKKLQLESGNPTDVVDGMRALANIDKHFEKVGVDGKAMPSSVEAAGIITKGAVEPVAEQQAKSQVSVEKILQEPVTEVTVAKQAAVESERLVQNNLDVAKPEYEANLREDIRLSPDGSGMFGPGGKIDRVGSTAIRTISNAINSRFSSSTGKADVLHKYGSGIGAFTMANASFKKQLDLISKKYNKLVDAKGTSLIDLAWDEKLSGTAYSSQTAEVGAAIDKLTDAIFGVPGNQEATSLWERATLADIEAYTRRAGLDSPFPIDQLMEWNKAEGGSITSTFIRHWREWVGTARNPLDTLERLHYAALSVTTHKAVARTFTQIPEAISTVARDGFTKIKGATPDRNPLLAHIPEGTFVNDELLDQIKNLEKYMAEPRTQRGGIADWVNKTYAPLLGAWKYGVTVLRPGHHTRNYVSENSVTLMAEGFRNYARAQKAAAKAFFALRRYDGVDFNQWIKNLDNLDTPGIGGAPKATDVLINHTRFGKKSAKEIIEAAFKNGLFSNYHFTEDVIEGSGKIQKATDLILAKGTFVETAATFGSDFVNHQARLTHFLQIIMNEGNKGIYRTWDDLVTAAATRVRKHHPDGSMITPWEARNMRLIFPFYSWFRRIAPVIFEMALDQPGRFMMIPKASFNLAVAMGVNPQSLSDPFPSDQLFPSFLTDQLTGPITEINGKYYNIQPGIAAEDIVNQFVADPSKGIIGMVTPFLKVPAELMSGSQWGSKAKIKDYSDYIDSQIPGLGYLANISGYSVTGSITSMLNSGKLDQQYQAWKKNKDVQDQGISFVNWLTGAGISNMSKPSYINYAEIEKRNAAAADKNTRSPY